MFKNTIYLTSLIPEDAPYSFSYDGSRDSIPGFTRDTYLNIVGEHKRSMMSTLRSVGPVAFENSRGKAAPKNSLTKESGTSSREI